ncbi:MAG: TolC family protein [Aminobacterium sp.]|jgi:outer membrane protein|uniref:TolC family protein n=1 Tax=Aminobacterium sp. TaxID=1872491 RepID=UPI001BCD20D4|nr:TolC family protein [Aminobacterium sp.]MDD2207533.1 TolC family protein [Aminobacterium sp.]MDD3426568.1 TolC family protein [Aminobacterium sp.]MDD3707522.1 TolC family protein [Aminobacterium sp.]MDD4229359.1 TolC family protein [Aminobacterium sp.]MDD4552361.1 TolC family protein [Aminobacterium sp.]
MRHNRIFSFFILVVAIFVLVLSCERKLWAQSPQVLTESLVLELAQKNNPVLAAEAERVKQAQARFEGIKASQLPQLSTSITYQQEKEAPWYPVYLNGIPAPTGRAVAGFEKTYRAAISLNYLLYSSGGVENSIRSQKLAFEGAKAQETRVSQTVQNNVLKALYNLQRARAKLVIAEDVWDLSQEHLKQVESFYKHGVVAKNELLRVDVDVSEAELNRIRAVNAVDVAWNALERAVGSSLREKYVLSTPEESVKNVYIPEKPLDVALQQRAELKALDYALKSSLALAQAASAEGRPQVVLQAESYVVDDTFFPSEKDDWKISVTALWTFFDGGASKSKAKEARAAADEFLYRAEDFKKQICLEVSVAKLNLESAMQRINVAQKQVESAEEDYRMALKRYGAQVGTNIDVLDARVALTNARTQLVDAVYDTYTSESELLYSIGSNHMVAENRE